MNFFSLNQPQIIAPKLLKKQDRVNERKSQTPSSLEAIVLETLLHKVDEAIFFFDLTGCCLFANRPAESFFHNQKPMKIPFSYWDLFPDRFFGFSMKEALQFGLSHPKLYFTISDHEYLISSQLFTSGPISSHGLILLVRDIQKENTLQRIIKKQSHLEKLGEMTAAIAHEIRNPLGGIRGFASLLFRDLKNQTYLQEMAQMILEGTKSLENILSALLHFARPLQIHKVSTEMCGFLRKLIRFVKIDPAFPPNVTLQSHLLDQPFLAPIDPDHLQRALLNLIFNAFQAMPEGGTLSISLIPTTSTFELLISDTGIGMDEALQGRLFSPFFTTKKQGNGWGLVEVKKVIDAHGGSILIRSQKGKGSTFSCSLPMT